MQPNSHTSWLILMYKAVTNIWRESFKTVPQFPNLLRAFTKQFKHQCFWNQKRKTISHFKQVLLWHQKVNSLSLAAFNSQQHFVLGLCQVILGCEIVRNDGWLSAFCYLLSFSLEICGCWQQSKFLFSFPFFFCTTYQMNNSNYEKAYTTIILALNFVLTSVRDRAL